MSLWCLFFLSLFHYVSISFPCYYISMVSLLSLFVSLCVDFFFSSLLFYCFTNDNNQRTFLLLLPTPRPLASLLLLLLSVDDDLIAFIIASAVSLVSFYFCFFIFTSSSRPLRRFKRRRIWFGRKGRSGYDRSRILLCCYYRSDLFFNIV